MAIKDIIWRMFSCQRCLLCDEAVSTEKIEAFCDVCIETWREHLKLKCKKCGKVAGECLCLPKQVRAINHSAAVWCVFYDKDSKTGINAILYDLKRITDDAIIELCATMMKRNFVALCASRGINYKDYVVTYVARRDRSFVKYGFDHGERLARGLAKKLGLNVVHAFFNGSKKEQKSLTKEQRVKNALESFELKKKFKPIHKKYILVDDVMTSGSSLYACAKLLYDSGAESVIPVTFAKNIY